MHCPSSPKTLDVYMQKQCSHGSDIVISEVLYGGFSPELNKYAIDSTLFSVLNAGHITIHSTMGKLLVNFAKKATPF